MANTKIDVNKREDALVQTTVKDVNQDKVNAIVKFFKLLLNDTEKFNEKAAFNELHSYIGKHDRILYAPISNEIYRCYDNHTPDEADVIMGMISTNMDKLVFYTISEAYESRRKQTRKEDSVKQLEDTKKAILKIWDHINLAQQQYSVLKQSDDEYQQKFRKLISSYKEEMTKDMSNQLLTMVSIFTALAFLVFGGISSLDNIFSTQGIPLLKLMCIGTVWGLCILNLIFVFLFCVGKMTKLNFKSTDDPNASIFEKYPVVWWTDLILIIILVLCLWAYYIRTHSIDKWITDIFLLHPVGTFLGGSIIILLIIMEMCKWMIRKTSARKRDR